MKQNIVALSFGAGVQSTALLMLIINRDERLVEAMDGISELPTCVIFADPGAETNKTYQHVDIMKERAEDSGLKFVHVNGGSLTDQIELGRIDLPLFIKDLAGNVSILRRSCTNNHKIIPIKRALRDLMGYKPKQHVKHHADVWIGISLDEIQRMKESSNKWETKHFPLIEMEWRRSDCINYLNKIGLRHVGKSACVYCPFHNDRNWLDLKRNYPEEFLEACRIDEMVRNYANHPGSKLKNVEGLYIHKTGTPLRDVELGENQTELFDMFDNECDGMCGL